jgi:hypothetical protein
MGSPFVVVYHPFIEIALEFIEGGVNPPRALDVAHVHGILRDEVARMMRLDFIRIARPFFSGPFQAWACVSVKTTPSFAAITSKRLSRLLNVSVSLRRVC